MGVAAGVTSALMAASSGTLISLLLFFLAPLPLMVVAMGWGPISAAIGGSAAALGLGALIGLDRGAAYGVSVALPACWLGYLALLGRPQSETATTHRDAAGTPDLDWYPVGRILLWTAGFAALTTAVGMFSLGRDADTIIAGLRQEFQLVAAQGDDPSFSGQLESGIDAMLRLVPAAAGMLAMLTLTLNVWLAGRIALISGRLRRPWPDLKSAALPPLALLAFGIAIGLGFSGGLVAMLAQTAAAVLIIVYALIGFAVIHTLTSALKYRGIWLCCSYAIMTVTVWPILAVVLLGLADSLFGLRRRYLRPRPPPLSVS